MKLPTLIFWVLLITAVVMTCAGCESYAKYDHPACPVCDESYASDEHLDAHCATNFEEGSGIDPLLATKCLTCGIYFTHPSYGEHIKTCCP